MEQHPSYLNQLRNYNQILKILSEVIQIKLTSITSIFDYIFEFIMTLRHAKGLQISRVPFRRIETLKTIKFTQQTVGPKARQEQLIQQNVKKELYLKKIISYSNSSLFKQNFQIKFFLNRILSYSNSLTPDTYSHNTVQTVIIA